MWALTNRDKFRHKSRFRYIAIIYRTMENNQSQTFFYLNEGKNYRVGFLLWTSKVSCAFIHTLHIWPSLDMDTVCNERQNSAQTTMHRKQNKYRKIKMNTSEHEWNILYQSVIAHQSSLQLSHHYNQENSINHSLK